MKYNLRIVLAFFDSQGIPTPQVEHRFYPTRLWRFDFAWPDQKVALDFEGGLYVRGRHQRIKGFKNDIEKYNSAAVAGWRLFRVLPEDLCLVRTAAMLRLALYYRDGQCLLQSLHERETHLSPGT